MSYTIKKRTSSQTKRLYNRNIFSQINKNMKLNYSNDLNNFKNNIFSNQKSPHTKFLTPSHNSPKKLFLSKEKKYLPPKSPEFADKKTLILDLDETLVHSSFEPFQKNDIVLNINFDGTFYKIYVLVRPGAEEFIKKISKYYELVIFTASLSKYASPLLDKLDKGNNIQYRLYRNNCYFSNGIYIKPLKKVGRNLKDVVIVDNSPLAYAFDTENGLPISSWFDNKKDKELFDIIPLLIFLSKINDVRKYIKMFVHFDKIDYSKTYKIIDKEENIDNILINKELKKGENKNTENKKYLSIQIEDNTKNNENIKYNIFNKNNRNIVRNKKKKTEDNNFHLFKYENIMSSKKENIPFISNNNIRGVNSIKYKLSLYQNINLKELEKMKLKLFKMILIKKQIGIIKVKVNYNSN